MNIDKANAISEVDNNFKYFRTQLSALEKTHPKEFTLLHKQQIIEFFESENDAIKAGIKNCGEGGFSVQQVADTCIDLGYQSYVVI